MSDDPKLSRRYRDLPREEPPRALDKKILAASRRAVRPRRWTVPLASAAVIVLAVAVVAHIDREPPDAEVVTPQARVLETPPPAPARAPAQSRRDQAPQPAQKRAQRAEAAGAPAAPASMGEERKAIDEIRAARESANQAARARAQSAPSPQATTAVSASARVAPSPEQWLQRIADLRRQGRDEEADRELAEFRKRYPDYRLSEETKAKVERR